MDFTKNLVIIRGQVFPGSCGLITKPSKSRKERRVPSLDPLRPVLNRLCAFKQSDTPLLVGPRGGFLTTATVRDATSWDQVVADLGLPNLNRDNTRLPPPRIRHGTSQRLPQQRRPPDILAANR